ncbi:MAG: hypothetical protein HRT72_02575 [Flavobacteriales bacterium]|nr:hypothetical protein [Flavobacteriales bacterium]
MSTADPGEGNEMNQVAQILQETATLRKTKSKISSISGVLILLLVVFLIVDIVQFIRTYDTEEVITEVKSALPQFMSSPVVKNLAHSIQTEVLPTYVDELSLKLKESQGLIELECYSMIENIRGEMGPALQKKIIGDLEEILVDTNLTLQGRYPGLNEAEIFHILYTLRTEVQKQYPERINAQVKAMFDGINSSLKSLKNTDSYKKLAEVDTAGLERMLLTTSLELMIYELDPNAGNIR